MLLLEDTDYKLKKTLKELRQAKEELRQIKEENKKLNSMLNASLELNILLKNALYSKKSEKLTEDELLLPELISQFDVVKEKEELLEVEQSIDKIEKKLTNKKTSSKKDVGRKTLSDKLPTVEHIHDIPDSEKICPCGCTMKILRYEDNVKLQRFCGKK
jgi:hypothetical protein